MSATFMEQNPDWRIFPFHPINQALQKPRCFVECKRHFNDWCAPKAPLGSCSNCPKICELCLRLLEKKGERKVESRPIA